MYTAIEVLRSPRCIFKGIRENNEGELIEGWCYTGRPKYYRSRENEKRPLASGYLFMVFVSEDKIVIEWREEIADPDDDCAPLIGKDLVGDNISVRFGVLIWTAT